MNRYIRLIPLVSIVVAAVVPAQNWPARPVRILVGFAPGGSTDIVARLIAQEMAKNLGQQVIVDNRPGAGGNIAAELTSKAPPDGHTIFACTTGVFAIQPFLYSKLPYDPDKGLIPVTQTGSLPYIVVVHPSLPVRNIKEFVAFARPRPGQINYASSGVGTASHLSAAYFATAAGLNMVHVPYKGTGNAMSDLLAGQVVLMFDQPVSSLPQVHAGKLKVLGISSGQRFPTLPDIPTVAEQGLPGFEAISWAGVCAPGGTPRDLVNRLYTEVAKVLKVPEIRDRLLRDGIEPIGSTPDEFLAHTRREAVKWGKVVKDTGAKVE
ncbi:MAG TPA: tripartite tricarboxylate transporter substrate binding protein [Burkholderiales bacterium]|nr:tripartite tricarboxylate transporter substrate binding protein [Burkholderiales bacterium]